VDSHFQPRDQIGGDNPASERNTERDSQSIAGDEVSKSSAVGPFVHNTERDSQSIAGDEVSKSSAVGPFVQLSGADAL
jgi:hypothetical protein